MITIVESGGANIASIKFALERLGYTAELSHDPARIKKSSHVILPGVGSAQAAMEQLKKYALDETIRSLSQPVLGICLGMQLLFDYSEEGNVNCLQLIPGNIKLIPNNLGFTVPHMGWNTVNFSVANPLFQGVPQDAYVYYVHSYMAPVTESTIGVTNHGKIFAAAVQKDNFFGAQFHPERSGDVGAKILKNFLEL